MEVDPKSEMFFATPEKSLDVFVFDSIASDERRTSNERVAGLPTNVSRPVGGEGLLVDIEDTTVSLPTGDIVQTETNDDEEEEEEEEVENDDGNSTTIADDTNDDSNVAGAAAAASDKGEYFTIINSLDELVDSLQDLTNTVFKTENPKSVDVQFFEDMKIINPTTDREKAKNKIIEYLIGTNGKRKRKYQVDEDSIESSIDAFLDANKK